MSKESVFVHTATVHQIIKPNSRNSSSVMSSMSPFSMFIRVKGPEFLWIEEYSLTGFNTNSLSYFCCAFSARIIYICEMNFNVWEQSNRHIFFIFRPNF